MKELPQPRTVRVRLTSLPKVVSRFFEANQYSVQYSTVQRAFGYLGPKSELG